MSRYNIVHIQLSKKIGAFVLTKNGTTKRDPRFKNLLINTDFEIEDVKYIGLNPEEEILLTTKNCSLFIKYNPYLIRDDAAPEEIIPIVGYIYTENEEEYTNYEEAKLVFDLLY